MLSLLSLGGAVLLMVGIRLGGSALYAGLARLVYENPPRGVAFATLLREGIGFAGTAFLAMLAGIVGVVISNHGGETISLAYTVAVVQALLRFAAWLVTLTVAFDPERRALGRTTGFAVGGVVLGFFLDVPVAAVAYGELAYLLEDTRFC